MDSYGEGYAACHRGVDFKRNPYLEGSRDWTQWAKGWNAAYRIMSY